MTPRDFFQSVCLCVIYLSTTKRCNISSKGMYYGQELSTSSAGISFKVHFKIYMALIVLLEAVMVLSEFYPYWLLLILYFGF